MNVKEFRDNLIDRLAVGERDVLVLIAALRGKEYTVHKIDGAIAEAIRRWPEAAVAVNRSKTRAQSISSHLGWLPSFPALLLPNRRFLLSICETELMSEFSASGKGTMLLLSAPFRGQVFPNDAWGQFFDEEVVDHGEDNLVSWMKTKV